MSVRRQETDGIVVLTLDRPPANALDADLLESLRMAFRESAGAGAVVLTSALPSMFSAGWDLPSLVSRGRDWMEEFLESFSCLVREIFTFGPPVVAALPGHAIAGGLIVAAASDERYAAAGSGRLGLSEVVLGVPVPRSCLEIFRYAIGHRAAERLASAGENHSVEEAARIGLIDRIVAPEDLFQVAVDRARFLAGRPVKVYAAIKSRARSEAVERFDQARRADPFLDFWFCTEAQERIGNLAAKLSRR